MNFLFWIIDQTLFTLTFFVFSPLCFARANQGIHVSYEAVGIIQVTGSRVVEAQS